MDVLYYGYFEGGVYLKPYSMYIYIYIWTAAYKKYSYRRYTSITLDANHGLQSLLKVVGGIDDELRKEWIWFGTTHTTMELVKGSLLS